MGKLTHLFTFSRKVGRSVYNMLCRYIVFIITGCSIWAEPRYHNDVWFLLQ